MKIGKKYYGKYRGTVLENIDPENRGRILAQVPAVSSLLPTTWCEPCLPLAGLQAGAYFVPQLESGVWIEFEQGDPSYPIWTGCFWGNAAEVPIYALAGLPASPSIVLQTGLQNTLMISDMEGPAGGILLQIGPAPVIAVSINTLGITLQHETMMISMLEGVITITNGGASIILGPGTMVTVNGGSLIVT